MARDFYIAPAGSGTSGTGTSRSNPIVGLSNINTNNIGVTSGDRLILLSGTYYEQFKIPTNDITIICENTSFDGRFSINGSNTLNNSYIEAADSAWTNLDSLWAVLPNNVWRKGCNRIWSIWVDGVLCEPMATSNLANTVSTITTNLADFEYTMRTEVTNTIGATLYMRFPPGKTPYDYNLLASSTGRYLYYATNNVQTGVIEAKNKSNITFQGYTDIVGIYHAQGHRVVGFYEEQCTNLLVESGVLNFKHCFVPARIAGGDNIRFSFNASYCNNAIAVQNSNEATTTIFSKAGTIEIYDWTADHVGWFPRYDGSIVIANNDMDGGVGIGYSGGDIAKVIIRNGTCTNGGPANLVLKTGWSGHVKRGSGVICSTAAAMTIDELVIYGNNISDTSRTGITISGTGTSVTKTSIYSNLIRNSRPIPFATNWQSSIIGYIEKATQATPTTINISNNTIVGGFYTAAGIYYNRVNATSSIGLFNNILKDITIETGYAGNYGAIQSEDAGALTSNNNIFDNAGGGVLGRIVNTNYANIASWRGAGFDINGQEGTVVISTDGVATAGTANPIGTGLNYWAYNPAPSSINKEPLPITSIDIGAWQTIVPTHPKNLETRSNIVNNTHVLTLINQLKNKNSELEDYIKILEENVIATNNICGYSLPSIFSGDKEATTIVASELMADNLIKLEIKNVSLSVGAYIGIGTSQTLAETNAGSGTVWVNRFYIPPNTPATIYMGTNTAYAWKTTSGTAILNITQSR
jgi:hypothetical protein